MHETPITFVDRQRGESKIHGGEAVAAARILLGLGWDRCLGRTAQKKAA